MLASNLPSERAACGNCAQLVFVCVCVSECLCANMCLCVRMCAKGLLVFADLLTRCVMLFGFCHCIHLGAHVRRSRVVRRGALRVAYVCQRVFGRVHVCVLMFINA